LIDGRDVDSDDDRAVHLVAFRGDRAVGACRLLYPEGAARSEPVFLGRITVVDPEDRARGSVAAALIGRSWLEIRAGGYSRISGLTSAPMLRLLHRMGFNVRVVGPPVRHFGEDRVPIVFGPGDGHAELR
jgi:N-acyl-L-homoserine lactone synthetase